MRLPPHAWAFGLAALLAWGCTVYDNGLVPDATEQMTGGSGKAGTSSSKAGAGTGASTSAAGLSGSAGKGVEPSGGTFSMIVGGNMAMEAGAGGDETVTPNGGAGGVGGSAGAGGMVGGGTAGASAGNAGNGGTAGAANTPKCADHPITAKTKWVATASISSLGTGVESDGLYNPPAHMTDGDFTERWSTGQAQAGVEWIQIDFGATVNVTQVTLNVSNDTGDYPRSYEVRLAAKSVCDAKLAVDPKTMRTCDSSIATNATGDGAPGNTVVTWFKPQTGRYLNVQQTATNIMNAPWWSIAEVLVTCTDQ